MEPSGYVELNVIIPSPDDTKREMAIALLSEEGFSSFLETPSGINAYIDAGAFDEAAVSGYGLERIEGLKGATFSHSLIEKVNWNREWEKNFEPVLIGGRCCVRASFHQPDPVTEYDIIIDPKMSFGTGHHHTTALMAEMLLELPVKDKDVIDIGCGTGILAILAAKRGASSVDAADIDEWAVSNTAENARINSVDITVWQGDIASINGKSYDIVLANITRNILLENMISLCDALRQKGTLFLSGFYQTDICDITEAAKERGLERIATLERDSWCAAAFVKH